MTDTNIITEIKEHNIEATIGGDNIVSSQTNIEIEFNTNEQGPAGPPGEAGSDGTGIDIDPLLAIASFDAASGI